MAADHVEMVEEEGDFDVSRGGYVSAGGRFPTPGNRHVGGGVFGPSGCRWGQFDVGCEGVDPQVPSAPDVGGVADADWVAACDSWSDRPEGDRDGAPIAAALGVRRAMGEVDRAFGSPAVTKALPASELPGTVGLRREDDSAAMERRAAPLAGATCAVEHLMAEEPPTESDASRALDRDP